MWQSYSVDILRTACRPWMLGMSRSISPNRAQHKITI